MDQKETTALNGVAGQIVAQVVHDGDTARHVFESIGFLGQGSCFLICGVFQ